MFARGWTSCAEVLAWGGGLLGRFLRRCLGDFVGGFWRVLWEVFSCILLCLHVFYLFFTIKFKNIFLLVFCYFLLLSPMNFLLTLFWRSPTYEVHLVVQRGGHTETHTKHEPASLPETPATANATFMFILIFQQKSTCFIIYSFLQFFTVFYSFLHFFSVFYSFLQFFTGFYSFL